MRLDEYLRALEECQDEKLKGELGVTDNWPIFLNAELDTVVKYLREPERYELEKTTKETDGTRHIFNYIPGTVKLQIFDWVSEISTTGCGLNNNEKDRIESERQIRDYNITIMLHPYQEKKIEGVHRLRVIAMVINDIGQFIIKENIPVCIPRTGGYTRGGEDYSKIIYHEPKTPAP